MDKRIKDGIANAKALDKINKKSRKEMLERAAKRGCAPKSGLWGGGFSK